MAAPSTKSHCPSYRTGFRKNEPHTSVQRPEGKKGTRCLRKEVNLAQNPQEERPQQIVTGSRVRWKDGASEGRKLLGDVGAGKTGGRKPRVPAASLLSSAGAPLRSQTATALRQLWSQIPKERGPGNAVDGKTRTGREAGHLEESDRKGIRGVCVCVWRGTLTGPQTLATLPAGPTLGRCAIFTNNPKRRGLGLSPFYRWVNRGTEKGQRGESDRKQSNAGGLRRKHFGWALFFLCPVFVSGFGFGVVWSVERLSHSYLGPHIPPARSPR